MMENKMTVERNIDFKDLAAVFMERLAAPLELFLNTVGEGEAEADKRLREAADAYKNDLASRKSALNEKIGAVQTQLEVCKSETEKAVEALSAALSHDDEAGEAAAKKVVDDQAQAEFLLQRRMDTLSRVSLTGNDDLYLAVLDAASDYMTAQSELKEAVNLVEMFIDELSSTMTEIRRKAEGKNDKYNYWKKYMTGRVWPVIENHDGAPDFSGASAGEQDSCRFRFVKAICERVYDTGFNYSPASEQLIKTIKSISAGDMEKA